MSRGLHGFSRILSSALILIRESPCKSVASFYLLCGRLAGGMIPFIRKYSTIWP